MSTSSSLELDNSNQTSINPETESESTISVDTLLYILPGVAVATKAPALLVQTLTEHVQTIGKTLHNSDSQHHGTLSSWLKSLQELSPTTPGLRPLFTITLAVSLLRQKSTEPIHPSPLSTIWSLVRTAILTAKDTPLTFTPNRSAQGFLAIPLCSLLTPEGKILELWRFHVWLPDSQRGIPEIAIHAHPPWARSWILVGKGTDQAFNVDTVLEGRDDEATHALYELSYNASSSSSSSTTTSSSKKAYQTHQLSSTICNTGKLMRAMGLPATQHVRDETYIVPAGVYHRSSVPGQKLHATLFVFDSSQGYEADAGVLGPREWEESTQMRDAGGITGEMLVRIVEEARSWEEVKGGKAGEDDDLVVIGYYSLWRGLGLLEQGKVEEARSFLQSERGCPLEEVFASEPSQRHREYIKMLEDANAKLDKHTKVAS